MSLDSLDIGGGWFLSQASRLLDDDGKPIGNPNVAARFDDLEILDVPASKAADSRVMKTVICVKRKVLLGFENHMHGDIDATALKFDVKPDEAEALLLRYPEAWAAYLAYRKAPEQPGEAEFMWDVMGITPEPKQKARKRKEAAGAA